MANTLTKVGDLADEVAVLLRHDNLDQRIYTWIGMTYNEISQRQPIELFYETSILDFDTDGSHYMDIGVEIGKKIGTPLAATFVHSNNDTLWVARYVTPADYSRLRSTGAEIASSKQPLVWTIINRDLTMMNYSVFINPPVTIGDSEHLIMTLFWAGKYVGSPLSDTSYLELPYHFEHVLIWGAAALGASILRPSMFQAYKQEAEQFGFDMRSIMAYRPDSTPVLRSITGPYAGTPKLQGPPRFPTNITPA